MSKTERINIGLALKDARNEQGLTLEQVADHFGVTHKSVQFWEQGRNEIKLTTFLELCKLYKVSPDKLISNILNK